MQILELTTIQANLIAITLPIVIVCLFLLIIPWLKKESPSRLRRYLSYLFNPPQLGSHENESQKENVVRRHTLIEREEKVRLYFYYLAIVLFLVSFIIGEFYEVIFDLLLPVSQGSTGELREVTNVIFQNPFSAGWIGTLPWMGLVTYHETWSWIYFTAAFTDNPDFLGTVIIVQILISIGVGLVFLVPLAIKEIRHSFLSSMFFFTTGMTIFTKSATSSFAYALALAFNNAELEYISIVATGSMIPGLTSVIAILFTIVLAMFALYIILGRKLWQVFYTDSKSRTWFMMYIVLSFLLGIALTIMVV